MKNRINTLFKKMGFNPPFEMANFKKAEANYSELISLEQQAVDFVKNALSVVNEALRSELKRNGYNPEAVKTRELTVHSSALTSKIDKRFKSQIYSVDGFVILRVEWKPNGFTIVKNTSEVATARKKALRDSLAPTFDIKSVEEKAKYSLDLDALTNKKMDEEKKSKLSANYRK